MFIKSIIVQFTIYIRGVSSSSLWTVVSAHIMKSGSLRFEFEVEVNRNILVLFSLQS